MDTNDIEIQKFNQDGHTVDIGDDSKQAGVFPKVEDTADEGGERMRKSPPKVQKVAHVAAPV